MGVCIAAAVLKEEAGDNGLATAGALCAGVIDLCEWLGLPRAQFMHESSLEWQGLGASDGLASDLCRLCLHQLVMCERMNVEGVHRLCSKALHSLVCEQCLQKQQQGRPSSCLSVTDDRCQEGVYVVVHMVMYSMC